MKTCIQVSAKLLNKGLEVSLYKICGMNINFFPLLVDEGYLFVDLNGIETKLFVSKR